MDDVANIAAQLRGIFLGGILSIDINGAACRLHQAVNHLQRGGLTATRRPDESDQLACRNFEGKVLHGGGVLARIGLGDVIEDDAGTAIARVRGVRG